MVNRKTKKKRKAPLVRLTILIILILAIGFFIFYSIDNPQFIRGLFSSGQSGEDSEETVEELSPVEESESAEEDVPISEDTEENEAVREIIDESGPDDSDSSEPLSLWQRILAFFTNRGKASGNEDTYPPRITINIYFASTGEEKILASEERTVVAGSPGNALNNAMGELLEGPGKSYHFPVIPAGTKLLGAKAYDGVAEIDLSSEFLENSLDSRILDEYIIYSIVNTVTEIQDINGVIFFIEGKRIKMYGAIDLSIPLIRDPVFLEEEKQ